MNTVEEQTTQYTSHSFLKGSISAEELDECVRFRTRIYREAGYVHQPEQSAGPDCYDAQSVHVCIRERGSNALVGYSRMIHGRPYPLPIAQLYPSLAPHLDHLVEISRFSTATETRGRLNPVGMAPAFYLAHELMLRSMDEGITQWCCLIDERFHRLCTRFFKMKFIVLDDPVDYMGSLSVPCVVELNESVRNNLNNPAFADFWNLGRMRKWAVC